MKFKKRKSPFHNDPRTPILTAAQVIKETISPSEYGVTESTRQQTVHNTEFLAKVIEMLVHKGIISVPEFLQMLNNTYEAVHHDQ